MCAAKWQNIAGLKKFFSHARIKKLVKTLMEFFRKFAIFTENPINFGVTCSVILGTAGAMGCKVS